MYNLALRMLGNVQAAEDATQEALLSAWRGIGKFKGGNFRTWLYRITANVCRDELRRLKRRPTISLEDLPLEPPDLPSTESPEDYTMRQELSQQIQSGLDQLPPELRIAVILRNIQGLSYEEIAQALNCPLGTVRSRISRGRTQLRDYLKPG